MLQEKQYLCFTIYVIAGNTVIHMYLFFQHHSKEVILSHVSVVLLDAYPLALYVTKLAVK